MQYKQELIIDCCVGVDFQELYGVEHSQDSIRVKSRNSYVIFLANCLTSMRIPKHHSEVALSTTAEAEYNLSIKNV